MGFLRLVLALLVVAQHVAATPLVGKTAVFVFFMISGYLMTLVMHETYGYSYRGMARFWANRALRLLPSHWVVVALTLVAIGLVGFDAFAASFPRIGVPVTPVDWLQNLTMVYWTVHPMHYELRLTPVTWALTVELFNYFLISLGLTRTLPAALAWLATGLAFQVWAIALSGMPWEWSYTSIFGGYLPFAMGGVMYLNRARLFPWLLGLVGGNRLHSGSAFGTLHCGNRAALRLIALGGLALIALYSLRLEAVFGMQSVRLGLAIQILNLLPAGIVVAGCLSLTFNASGLRRADRLAGDLSYPVYLCHIVVAVAVQHALGTTGLGVALGPALFLISLPFVLLVSYALVVIIERPINRVRDRVRPDDAQSQPAVRAPG